jgi:CHAT domain-containing protein
VEDTVAQLQQTVTDPRNLQTTAYLSPAQQLYQWIIAPMQMPLQERQIGNIAFIMDAKLRSLPVAALHNGEQFLVEQFSVGLMPSISLTDTRYVDIRDSQVLAMGASVFEDKAPLPAVSVEIAAIANELWSGEAFLNDEFTLQNLKSQRQDTPFGIVHLATHADFLPGELDDSYIQLWDQQLDLAEVRQLGWNEPPVNLVVLSACRTALGNVEAELGFAGFAVQAGVKSALASLWYVSDEGTLGLMTEFYRQLQIQPIKAEALRQAQLAMIRGETQIVDGQVQFADGSAIALPPELENQSSHDVAHPFYWSAFTVIGSPW